MQKITIKDLHFELYLTQDQIHERIRDLGTKITACFQGEELIILGVLNGSFLFMADLVREIALPLRCEFIKVSSYRGTESTGKVKSILGLSLDLEGKNVLIIEDIVDTGITMDYLLSELSEQKPSNLSVATLLFKKDAFRFNYKLDYVGFEIPDKFVVGYGLDYDGLGRNLPNLYQLSKT